MPEDDLPIGIGELAFCLGVDMIGTENTNGRKKSNFDIIVHLLRLDDPYSVISRKKRAEEHFVEGKWYRQSAVGPKVYTQIDDIVPTGPAKADGKAKTFELVLPVFFAPDFFAADLYQQLGQVPRLKDPKFAGIPICPLFGDEASNCLPEVCWMQGSYLYSSELYELKTSLTFFKGIHTWKSPQCVDQLSPWNYEKYPAIGRISTEPSFTGIVVEQFTRTLQLRGPAIQFCVVLNKEAELALAMNPEGRAASLGEYREYLPMKLDCYDMPLLIALNRPQSHRGHEQQMFDTTDLEIQLQKRGQLFEFTLLYTSKRFTNVHTAFYLLPWLGKVYDPFSYMDDYESHEKEEEKRRISLKLLVRPNWHLPKGSVAWFVDGFGGGEEEVQQADDGDENVISQSSPTTLAPVHGNNAGSGFGLLSHGAATSASYHHQMGGAHMNISSDAGSDDAAFQLEESPSNNIPKSRELDLASPASSILNLDSSGDLELVETAIATFMTVSTWCGNDCAFLFWDANSGTFTRKCYAKFDSSLNFDGHSPGEWFELKYTQNADKENRITVYAFAHAQEQTETKFTNGICAQYRYVTNRDRFVSVWHACYPCPEKSSYYTDRGWWPWLCKKCFPDLPEVPQARTSPFQTSPTSTCQQTEPQVDPTEEVLFSTGNASVTAARWEVENTDSAHSSSPDNELAEFAENMKCSMNMSSSSMESLEGSNAGSMSYRSSNSKVSSSLSLQSSNSNEQKKQSNKSPPAASVKEEQEKENAEREKERKKKQTSIISSSGDETSFSSRLLRSAIGTQQQALAVLMAVREDRGDSVFLLYDDGKRKFVNRVYADLPEKIPGHPRIGSWYWLEYKSVAGQKITVLSVIEEPSAPVTTRIERIAGYTLAQAEEVYVPSRFVTDLLGAGALLLSSSPSQQPSSSADDQAVRPPSQPVPAATNGIVRRADDGSRRSSPTSSSLSGSTSGASQTAADQRQQVQQNDAPPPAVTVQPVPAAAAILANGAAPEPAAAESNLANGHDDPLPLPALNGGFGSARLRRQARDECLHRGNETGIRRQQQV